MTGRPAILVSCMLLYCRVITILNTKLRLPRLWTLILPFFTLLLPLGLSDQRHIVVIHVWLSVRQSVRPSLHPSDTRSLSAR